MRVPFARRLFAHFIDQNLVVLVVQKAQQLWQLRLIEQLEQHLSRILVSKLVIIHLLPHFLFLPVLSNLFQEVHQLFCLV